VVSPVLLLDEDGREAQNRLAPFWVERVTDLPNRLPSRQNRGAYRVAVQLPIAPSESALYIARLVRVLLGTLA